METKIASRRRKETIEQKSGVARVNMSLQLTITISDADAILLLLGGVVGGAIGISLMKKAREHFGRRKW
jgi:hypothetical protein